MRTIFILIFFFTTTCYSQSCEQLPESFSSYNTAISRIRNSSFAYMDVANTSRSSWITSAEYYSCDGKTGYLIYSTNKGYTYIHKGVPLEIWNAFKNATSIGSYYDSHIKGRYRLTITPP